MWKKKDIKITSIEDVFMKNIGVSSLEEVNEWFRRSYNNEWRIDGLKEAADFVLAHKGKPIRIIGDYDCDGCSGTAILENGLYDLGFGVIPYYIPLRFSEGFGVNKAIIDNIPEGLIITVDNGTAQVDVINYAKSKGLDVLIIDHHQPAKDDEGNPVLPDADIIINPNAIVGSAESNLYCGAGLAFRFIRELATLCGYPTLYKRYLALAALGTVADVMELREENYVIVRNGIKAMKNRSLNTTGVNALVDCALGKHISAHDIAFQAGPLINAASRMKDDGALQAVNLLTFRGEYPDAVSMAENLVSLNKERKVLRKAALEKAEEIIATQCLYGECPLVINVPNVPEGIIGITASDLCEKYNVPAIVLTDIGEGLLKGSGRSRGNYNMEAELNKVSDCMLKFGGHEGAAGMTVFSEKFAQFKQSLQANAVDFENTENADCIMYDLEIEESDIEKTCEVLEKYEPFGNGNSPIVFLVKGFKALPVFPGAKTYCYIGDGSIAKIKGSKTEAIGFGMFGRFRESVDRLNLVGSLSYNSFGNNVTPQVEFKDFEEVKSFKVETPLAKLLKS